MSENVDKLRNIALVAHQSAGKTSLSEAILYNTGHTTRLGRVEEGNTIMDFEPEELKRTSSISSGFHQLEWDKHTINIIDTPGDQNFFNDTKNSMYAADGAVLLIDAVDGIKVQTELAWNFAEKFNMPCMIVINKLDREHADFSKILNVAVEILKPKPISLHLPIGSELDFKGIIDLISMKAYIYEENSGKAKPVDIPADMMEEAETEREVLIENIAEADDAIIERYLEGETLTNDEIMEALRKGTLARIFAPVICTSATKNIGIDLFLNYVNTCMPAPFDRGSKKGIDDKDNEVERTPDPDAPFSAFVFKTIADPYAGRLSLFRIVSGTLGSDGNFYNTHKDTKERFNQLLSIAGKEQKPANGGGPGSIVAVAKLKETKTGDTLCSDSDKIKYEFPESMNPIISFALESKAKGDEDKIYISLTKLLEEDTALKLERNSETSEILLSGMGQVHIETVIEKLKRKFKVEVILNTPKVPYRETIKKKIRVQGKHKKQTGGHGQFGDCWVQIEPLPHGKGFEFVDAIVGGSIPKTYIPAVEKGIIEAAAKGMLAGFPCVDFRATLDDGSFHAVDSSEMAFKIAGSLAFRKAAEQANPVLLEPIMEVAITTPDDYMGDIMGDLNGRRGRVLGMDTAGKNQVIKANVPMAEFLTYAPDLRSITGGRGIFTMKFSHYDEVPAQESQKILDEIEKNKE